MAAQRPYDIVVFGATGFTGFCVYRQLARLHSSMRLAVAGRRAGALESVVREITEFLRRDGLTAAADAAAKTGLIVATSESEESLRAMASQATVVVSCVGPFRRYGRPVVAACVASGAHYCDISGEPEFMERMEAEFGAAARAARTLVVSACGMDSIPCDMGVEALREEFAARGGVLTAVKAVMSVQWAGGWLAPVINFGTWDSLVHSLANANELRAIRRAAPRVPVAYVLEPLPRQRALALEPVTGAAVVPFLGADASVVRRSMMSLPAGVTPVRFDVFLQVSSRLSVLLFYLWGLFLTVMTLTRLGQRILLMFPRLCSAGIVAAGGPSAETRASTVLTLTLVGRGLARRADLSTARATDMQLIARWRAVDPGYDATAGMVATAAATMVQEAASMPAGGVMTTATAFRGTSLVKRMVRDGVVSIALE